MNERQRDLFLWLWSRRRQRGQLAAALMGAAAGALGGLLFALILGGEAGADRGAFTGVSVIIPMLERGGALMAAAVPAFAGIGFVLASRIFAAQETMYESMLDAGARVPDRKPHMQMRDRGPALAVAVVLALLGGCIVVLFAMYW